MIAVAVALTACEYRRETTVQPAPSAAVVTPVPSSTAVVTTPAAPATTTVYTR
jgi:hypothetical protein